MLVVEGKQSWAIALRNRRSELGLSPPRPTVSYSICNSSADNAEFVNLLRVMMEGAMDKELIRLIVSFI